MQGVLKNARFCDKVRPFMTDKNWREYTAEETAEYGLPYFVSPAFKELIEHAAADDRDALRRQVEFSVMEKKAEKNETADPLGENKYCITPYLVHQYKNRVLLLTSGKCLSYCRYCFRRGFTGRNRGYITEDELAEVCSYLLKNPQIKEILVSGGDPLSGSFEDIRRVLYALRNTSETLLIRLCTRAPIFAPEVFTPQLLCLLQKARPLWLIPHINHTAELGKKQRAALTACIDSGIPVQSQTVLLKGVNDNAGILVKLFHTLACMGVKPGYLFQLDPAAGTSHFRVPLKNALAIWRTLETELSGLSRPQFAADLPGGGGKFPLSALVHGERIIEQFDGTGFSAIGSDSRIHTYAL